jgi:sterol 3beta-glucosyltransferase/vancomycin aglycone glucosyltransferase
MRPFIALAAGLAAAGHEVRLLLTDLNRGDYGAQAHALGFSCSGVATAHLPEGNALEAIGRQIFATRSPLRQLQILMRCLFEPARPELFAAARTLCATSDVVVGHLVMDPLRAAAQLADVPWLTLSPAPLGIPSAIVPPFGTPALGRWVTPLLWRLARSLLNRSFLPGVNAFRARHGLAPDADLLTQSWSSAQLNLIPVSAALVQRAADWGAQHCISGFLTLPVEQLIEPVPPALENFLADGAPPVYFTFGSMMPRNREVIIAAAQIWTEAVRANGCRAIFQLPWHNLDDVPVGPGVFAVQSAPHRRIFPRCALVVHHGGAGTTQAVLLAGRPSVVVPHVIDQFFWAARLRELGVAGQPIARDAMNATNLTRAIAAVRAAPALAQRARIIGATMAQEDGVKAAVAAIEGFATGHGARSVSIARFE